MLTSSFKCALILALFSLPLLAARARHSSLPMIRKGKKTELADALALGATRSTLKSKRQLLAERELRLSSVKTRKLTGLHPRTEVRMHAALGEMRKAGLRPTITSAYRSQAQQREIYSCAHRNRCRARRGIYGARKPGTSLHEAGLAVDLADVAHGKRRRHLTRNGKKMVKIMQHHGFKWRYGLKDPAHFEIDPRTAGYRSEKQAILAARYRPRPHARTTQRHRS